MRSIWTGVALAGALVMVPAGQMMAQGMGAAETSAQSTGADVSSGMTNEQLLPMTVHEAWVASGRNEDKFFAMVSQLTELSAQKRGVTLPDTTAAGQRAGEHFKQVARRDPGQLLYVVVDQMVRHMASKGTASEAATK